jgi:hypothetical protein
MPKTSPYRVFNYQQPAELLDRNAVSASPLSRPTRLQSFAVPARQLGHDPCRYPQSMGATVRLKTGILHNVTVHQQMKANPGIVPRRTGLTAGDGLSKPWVCGWIPCGGKGPKPLNLSPYRSNRCVDLSVLGESPEAKTQ